MSSHDNHYFAWERESERAGSKATLTAAFSHDYAGEIDEKNSWSAPDAPDERLHNELIAVASRGLSELVRFAFPAKITRQGKGMPAAVTKFIAVAQMLEPQVFIDEDTRQLTKEEVAQRAGVSAHELKKTQDEFLKRMGFRVIIKKKRS